MKTLTLYIVPAWSDQAGQCRIVSREGKCTSARDDYRQNPQLWAEAGRMNSRGELVCLTAPPGVFAEVKSCEPLMASLEFAFEFEDEAAQCS